jgi:hypothetical protein
MQFTSTELQEASDKAEEIQTELVEQFDALKNMARDIEYVLGQASDMVMDYDIPALRSFADNLEELDETREMIECFDLGQLS